MKFEFEDGSKTKRFIPAEIWKKNDKMVSKLFYFKKEIKSIVLDPNLETADVDTGNNYWPARHVPSRFELFNSLHRWEQKKGENPMQKQRRIEKMQKEDKD